MFDSLTIYCLATGKPYATLNDDSLGLLLEVLPHGPERDARLETICLSSMRNSPFWMTVDPTTLDVAREYAPRELLAYLLNRMYAPIHHVSHSGKPVEMQAWLRARATRIEIWRSVESAVLLPDQLDSILLVLLSIDSRFNLAKQQKPAAVTTLWQTWTEDSASELIHQLWLWHNRLAEQQERAQRQAKHQAEFWSEGNRLTRQAMTQQFAKVTPPSATKKAAIAKVAKLKDSLDFLDALEKELSTRNEPIVIVAAKPVVKTFTRFGAKKVES